MALSSKLAKKIARGLSGRIRKLGEQYVTPGNTPLYLPHSKPKPATISPDIEKMRKRKKSK